MNIPTQTQLCRRIIEEHLSWSVLDSDGRPAHKPEGMDDLTCLLICHKQGTFNIEAGPPGPLPTVRVKVEGGVAAVWECPQGVEVEVTDHDGDADRQEQPLTYKVGHDLMERSVE